MTSSRMGRLYIEEAASRVELVWGRSTRVAPSVAAPCGS